MRVRIPFDVVASTSPNAFRLSRFAQKKPERSITSPTLLVSAPRSLNSPIPASGKSLLVFHARTARSVPSLGCSPPPRFPRTRRPLLPTRASRAPFSGLAFGEQPVLACSSEFPTVGQEIVAFSVCELCQFPTEVFPSGDCHSPPPRAHACSFRFTENGAHAKELRTRPRQSFRLPPVTLALRRREHPFGAVLPWPARSRGDRLWVIRRVSQARLAARRP